MTAGVPWEKEERGMGRFGPITERSLRGQRWQEVFGAWGCRQPSPGLWGSLRSRPERPAQTEHCPGSWGRGSRVPTGWTSSLSCGGCRSTPPCWARRWCWMSPRWRWGVASTPPSAAPEPVQRAEQRTSSIPAQLTDVLKVGQNVDVTPGFFFSPNWSFGERKIPLSKGSSKPAFMSVCDVDVVPFLLLLCSSALLPQLLSAKATAGQKHEARFCISSGYDEDESSSFFSLISLSNSSVINQPYSFNPSGIGTKPPLSLLKGSSWERCAEKKNCRQKLSSLLRSACRRPRLLIFTLHLFD